ncbi:MAG: FtsX-like permease family protein [Mycobacteriaceae bacterium]|nr:FtsX-like permease family protein [Mycobacteriaceae bacterium]
MMSLAFASLRHRLSSFAASFVAVLLCTLVVGAFATLVETGIADATGADRKALVIMGAVIGGWGGLIALFALVSTLSVGVRRRDVEIGLLRSIGATPGQTRRLVRAETFVVSLAAAALGALLALPAGAALFHWIRDAGMVSASVEFAGGPAALSITAAAVVVVGLAAAGLASRRATGGAARFALASQQVSARLPRWRALVGWSAVAYSVGLGFVTVFVTGHTDNPYDAMQSSGSSSILAGIGLAAVAPTLLRLAARPAGAILERVGPAGHLAAFNAARRAHLLGGVLGPVIVFTGAAAGVLMLEEIDNRTRVLPPDLTAADADMISMLNNVVVAMIAAFAAILVVNAILANIGDRRAEFGRLRLVGATPEQVKAAVTVETAFVAVLGAVLGLVASLATFVPFSIARHEGVVPDGQLWLPGAVAVLAVVLAVVTARQACGRALDGAGAHEALAAL